MRAQDSRLYRDLTVSLGPVTPLPPLPSLPRSVRPVRVLGWKGTLCVVAAVLLQCAACVWMGVTL